MKETDGPIIEIARHVTEKVNESNGGLGARGAAYS